MATRRTRRTRHPNPVLPRMRACEPPIRPAGAAQLGLRRRRARIDGALLERMARLARKLPGHTVSVQQIYAAMTGAVPAERIEGITIRIDGVPTDDPREDAA